MSDWIHRIASLCVALGYIVAALIFGDAKAAWLSVAVPILALACIWFPDEMGAYKMRWHWPPIDMVTPGSIVRIGGWALLLLPAAIFLLSRV